MRRGGSTSLPRVRLAPCRKLRRELALRPLRALERRLERREHRRTHRKDAPTAPGLALHSHKRSERPARAVSFINGSLRAACLELRTNAPESLRLQLAHTQLTRAGEGLGTCALESGQECEGAVCLSKSLGSLEPGEPVSRSGLEGLESYASRVLGSTRLLVSASEIGHGAFLIWNAIFAQRELLERRGMPMERRQLLELYQRVRECRQP